MPLINLLMSIEIIFYLQRWKNLANFRVIFILIQKIDQKFVQNSVLCFTDRKSMCNSFYCCFLESMAEHVFILMFQQLLRHNDVKFVRFVYFNDCILQRCNLHNGTRCLFSHVTNIIFGNFVKLSVLPLKRTTILCDMLAISLCRVTCVFFFHSLNALEKLIKIPSCANEMFTKVWNTKESVLR